MRSLILTGILSVTVMSALVAADGPAPTDPAAKPAATANTSDQDQVAFAIITVSSDKHSITLTDGKASGLTLTVTDKTTITRELKAVKLSELNADQQVRITYHGTTAVSIDQLGKEKKKKKKPV
ncbi:MAG TPA: hypothetical protein VHX44_04705 [Planctomycetota bacterium]|nr:hypothetical protein [Planctomycetota bacterium]